MTHISHEVPALTTMTLSRTDFFWVRLSLCRQFYTSSVSPELLQQGFACGLAQVAIYQANKCNNFRETEEVICTQKQKRKFNYEFWPKCFKYSFFHGSNDDRVFVLAI